MPRQLIPAPSPTLSAVLSCATTAASALVPCADNNPQPGGECCTAVEALVAQCRDTMNQLDPELMNSL